MKRNVKSHDQHFLRSPAFIAELIGHSNIRPRDTVLDIGAGSGAITAVLARRAGRVIAVENEPSALVLLRKNMQRYANVEVVGSDIESFQLPEGPYKVFANIPFSLSSPIVRRLTTASAHPRSIYLIVQKQFARKLEPQGEHFHAALGMMIAPWWTVRIRRPLRRTDFTPPPAVDTVLLELKFREQELLAYRELPQYMAFVERCYADPTMYRRTTLPKDKRPSQLTVDDWLSGYRAHNNTASS